jgi:hypothetical protein
MSGDSILLDTVICLIHIEHFIIGNFLVSFSWLYLGTHKRYKKFVNIRPEVLSSIITSKKKNRSYTGTCSYLSVMCKGPSCSWSYGSWIYNYRYIYATNDLPKREIILSSTESLFCSNRNIDIYPQSEAVAPVSPSLPLFYLLFIYCSRPEYSYTVCWS